jgi:hypothetical protein
MIFYGLRHSGKKTAMYAFLRDMYGPFETSYKRVTFNDGKTITVPVFYSEYHIEIDVLSFYSQVRTILPKLIKSLSSTRNILDSNIKLLVIHHMECLETQTQHTLRRIIEMYFDNCRFLFLTSRLNSISQPLQSRCLLVRIPVYTDKERRNIAYEINKKLEPPLLDTQIDDILEMKYVTIKDLLFQMEFSYYKLGVYERPIDTVSSLVEMITTSTVNRMLYNKVDTILYKYMFKNFNLYDLFYDLFKIVYPMIPFVYKKEYLCIIADIDVDMTRGIREVTHLQTHVYYIIDLFRRIRCVEEKRIE